MSEAECSYPPHVKNDLDISDELPFEELEFRPTRFKDNPGECLKEYLLPTVSRQQRDREKEYIERAKGITNNIDIEIRVCKAMIRQTRMRRLRRIRIKDADNIDGVSYDGDYCKDIRESNELIQHLQTLRENQRQFTFLAKTQANADRAGFHGLSDWAEQVTKHHEDLLVALYSISFVGAGLTYTTIFSASRGNLGIMCYSWGLFNCGFIIPIASLSLLKWASNRGHETLFASPKVWSLFLNAFIYVSVVAVGAAIILLNVTIIDLHSRWSTDAAPEFNVLPVPAGVFALVCAGITAVMTAVAITLHYVASGWRKLVGDVMGRNTGSGNETIRLQEFFLG